MATQPRRLPGSRTEVEIWEYHADGTQYRGVMVPLPNEPGSAGFDSVAESFGLGADVLIAVEPAGGAKNLHPSRMWATFRRDKGLLVQSYVAGKFAVKGEDAANLTIMVAAMLGRAGYIEGE